MARSRRRRVALVASVLLAALGLPGPVPLASAASPFTDIADSIFKADIEWLCAEGITTGCYPTLYCPDARVRRDEMASFMARMFDLPPVPAGTDYFTDDDANIHEHNINRVAAAGITTGCMPQKYCPTAWVRRDQIASFIARAIPFSVGGLDYSVTTTRIHMSRTSIGSPARGSKEVGAEHRIVETERRMAAGR